jgi:hypothetical protein
VNSKRIVVVVVVVDRRGRVLSSSTAWLVLLLLGGSYLLFLDKIPTSIQLSWRLLLLLLPAGAPAVHRPPSPSMHLHPFQRRSVAGVWLDGK